MQMPIDTTLNQFIDHLGEYRKIVQENQDETVEETEKALVALEFANELVNEIAANINEIIQNSNSQESYRDKLKPYISNRSLQSQIGKTLFEHPELKSLSNNVLQNQILTILDKIFCFPISKDYKILPATEINPIITQLTRAILVKPLIEASINFNQTNEYSENEESETSDDLDLDLDNFENEDLPVEDPELAQELEEENDIEDPELAEELEKENHTDELEEANGLEDFIEDERTEAIANLGYLGLAELQKQLKDCDREDREKLSTYIWLINNYNPRSLNKDSLNIDLLLDIFNQELTKSGNNDPGIRTILELTAETLSKFDLELDSAQIDDFVNKLQDLREDRQTAALQALANTKIKEKTAAADLITNYMMKILICSNENQNKLFASQFLINNSQLSSQKLINSLVTALQVPDSEKLETSFCALVVLNSWTRDSKLRTQIKDAIIDRINCKLSKPDLSQENNDLSILLLALAPLLDSSKTLFDIYSKYQDRFDHDNCLYIAAAIARFEKESIDQNLLQIEEGETALSDALKTVNKIINQDNAATKKWDPMKLSRIQGLANSDIRSLIKQNLEKEAFTFEMFLEAMKDTDALESLNRYLQQTNLRNQELAILINVIATRVVNLNDYVSTEGQIDNGELTTLITKFANSSNSNREIATTITKLFESYNFLYKEDGDKLTNDTIEQSLICGLSEIGVEAEPHLLKIIEEAQKHSFDPTKTRQAKLAERILMRNRYLPELAA